MSNEHHKSAQALPSGVSLFDYQKYGIAKGQHYVRADGSRSPVLVVVDVETHAHRGEVVVQDIGTGEMIEIDAFKLAMVRYSLVPPSDVDEILRINKVQGVI